jgi:hypothetical protein
MSLFVGDHVPTPVVGLNMRLLIRLGILFPKWAFQQEEDPPVRPRHRGHATFILLLVLAMPGLMTPNLAAAQQESRQMGRFLFIYNAQDREHVDTLANLLDGVFSDLEGAFGTFPWPKLPVYLHPYAEYRSRFGNASDAHYTPQERAIHIGYVAMTPRSTTDLRMEAYVIHEAAHAFQHALTGLPPYAGSPIWFAEGLARYCERHFVRNSPFPTAIAPQRVLSPLDANPYENGYQAIDYLIARAGMGSIAKLFGRIANGVPFDRAFTQTYGLTIPELQAALRNR